METKWHKVLWSWSNWYIVCCFRKMSTAASGFFHIFKGFDWNCLKNNYFVFWNLFYLQISGTVLGALFAPSLTNLYMEAFKEQHLSLSIYSTYLSLWKRDIDDIFVLYTGTLKQLNVFHLWLNNQMAVCNMRWQLLLKTNKHFFWMWPWFRLMKVFKL